MLNMDCSKKIDTGPTRSPISLKHIFFGREGNFGPNKSEWIFNLIFCSCPVIYFERLTGRIEKSAYNHRTGRAKKSWDGSLASRWDKLPILFCRLLGLSYFFHFPSFCCQSLCSSRGSRFLGPSHRFQTNMIDKDPNKNECYRKTAVVVTCMDGWVDRGLSNLLNVDLWKKPDRTLVALSSDLKMRACFTSEEDNV